MASQKSFHIGEQYMLIEGVDSVPDAEAAADDPLRPTRTATRICSCPSHAERIYPLKCTDKTRGGR